MTRPPWKREPAEVGAIPTMISREERRYLHWLGRTQWSDRGHVLEIGPWLGGSTVCLAAGMQAGRAAPKHALHAVDNFRWREFMANYAPLKLEPGESFERYFREHVARFGGLVRSHALALPDETIAVDPQAEAMRAKASEGDPPFTWPASEPVEVLFIDGAKSWRGMRHLLASVSPALLPGCTLLVAQDYKHWGAYWVPLFLWRFREQLELVHDVRRGSTVTFRLTRAFDVAAIERLPDSVAALDPDEAVQDFARAAAVLDAQADDQGAAQVRLASVALLSHRGRVGDAAAIYERALATWPRGADVHALKQARSYLLEHGVQQVSEVPRVSRLARLRRRLLGRA